MKSKVTYLYDMRQASVPEELRKWRVSEAEVQVQLARVAAAHPVETKPSTVALGDSVLCRTAGKEAKWNRDALPFYPGRNMLPEVETALVGMQVGETREVGDKEITVMEITRRQPAPLTDALIAEEGIEGVSTLAQYRDWWKHNTEQDRRNRALSSIVYCLQAEVVSHSQILCDEAEMDRMSHKMAQKQYTAMVNAGIDPTVPDEGVDFLTEEEALEKMAQENRMRLMGCIVNEHYATVLYPMPKEEYETALKEMEMSMGKTRDELLEYAGETLVNDFIYNKVFYTQASAYAETLLED